MENKGIYHWEDDKSKLLQKTRGYSIKDIVNQIFFSGRAYLIKESPRYPNQYRVVAKIDDMIITVAMEDIDDGFGQFYRIVTYWESDSKDKKLYKKELNDG